MNGIPDDPLMQKLDHFVAQGWIRHDEYRQYRKQLLLQHGSSSCMHRQVVENELDHIAARHELETTLGAMSLSPSSAAATSLSSIRSHHHALPSILQQKQRHKQSKQSSSGRDSHHHHHHHVSWEDQSSNEAAETTNNTVHNNQNRGLVIVENPADLNLSSEQLQVLFVELCFFARLGFVQPPSCLLCAYKQAAKATNNDNDGSSSSTAKPQQSPVCQKWIVWRRNANQLLHPLRLQGNLVLVQCHAATQLLEGRAVQGWTWNAQEKRLTRE